MKMLWVGMSGVLLGCVVGCGSTSGGEGEEMGGAAGSHAGNGGMPTSTGGGGSASGGASTGGTSPSTAGTSTGGAAGGNTSGGASGTSGAAGMVGMAGSAGAGGSGGGAACNTLELVVEQPTCTTLGTTPASEGGAIVEGTYAMVQYQMPFCIAFDQTVRIEEVSVGTYRMDTVVSAGPARASATMVKQGNALSSTSTCGSSEVDQIYGYTTYREGDRDFLRIVRENEGSFVYRRVE